MNITPPLNLISSPSLKNKIPRSPKLSFFSRSNTKSKFSIKRNSDTNDMDDKHLKPLKSNSVVVTSKDDGEERKSRRRSKSFSEGKGADLNRSRSTACYSSRRGRSPSPVDPGSNSKRTQRSRSLTRTKTPTRGEGQMSLFSARKAAQKVQLKQQQKTRASSISSNQPNSPVPSLKSNPPTSPLLPQDENNNTPKSGSTALKRTQSLKASLQRWGVDSKKSPSLINNNSPVIASPPSVSAKSPMLVDETKKSENKISISDVKRPEPIVALRRQNSISKSYNSESGKKINGKLSNELLVSSLNKKNFESKMREPARTTSLKNNVNENSTVIRDHNLRMSIYSDFEDSFSESSENSFAKEPIKEEEEEERTEIAVATEKILEAEEVVKTPVFGEKEIMPVPPIREDGERSRSSIPSMESSRSAHSLLSPQSPRSPQSPQPPFSPRSPRSPQSPQPPFSPHSPISPISPQSPQIKNSSMYGMESPQIKNNSLYGADKTRRPSIPQAMENLARKPNTPTRNASLRDDKGQRRQLEPPQRPVRFQSMLSDHTKNIVQPKDRHIPLQVVPVNQNQDNPRTSPVKTSPVKDTFPEEEVINKDLLSDKNLFNLEDGDSQIRDEEEKVDVNETKHKKHDSNSSYPDDDGVEEVVYGTIRTIRSTSSNESISDSVDTGTVVAGDGDNVKSDVNMEKAKSAINAKIESLKAAINTYTDIDNDRVGMNPLTDFDHGKEDHLLTDKGKDNIQPFADIEDKDADAANDNENAYNPFTSSYNVNVPLTNLTNPEQSFEIDNSFDDMYYVNVDDKDDLYSNDAASDTSSPICKPDNIMSASFDEDNFLPKDIIADEKSEKLESFKELNKEEEIPRSDSLSPPSIKVDISERKNEPSREKKSVNKSLDQLLLQLENFNKISKPEESKPVAEKPKNEHPGRSERTIAESRERAKSVESRERARSTERTSRYDRAKSTDRSERGKSTERSFVEGRSIADARSFIENSFAEGNSNYLDNERVQITNLERRTPEPSWDESGKGSGDNNSIHIETGDASINEITDGRLTTEPESMENIVPKNESLAKEITPKADDFKAPKRTQSLKGHHKNNSTHLQRSDSKRSLKEIISGGLHRSNSKKGSKDSEAAKKHSKESKKQSKTKTVSVIKERENRMSSKDGISPSLISSPEFQYFSKEDSRVPKPNQTPTSLAGSVYKSPKLVQSNRFMNNKIVPPSMGSMEALNMVPPINEDLLDSSFESMRSSMISSGPRSIRSNSMESSKMMANGENSLSHSSKTTSIDSKSSKTSKIKKLVRKVSLSAKGKSHKHKSANQTPSHITSQSTRAEIKTSPIILPEKVSDVGSNASAKYRRKVPSKLMDMEPPRRMSSDVVSSVDTDVGSNVLLPNFSFNETPLSVEIFNGLVQDRAHRRSQRSVDSGSTSDFNFLNPVGSPIGSPLSSPLASANPNSRKYTQRRNVPQTLTAQPKTNFLGTSPTVNGLMVMDNGEEIYDNELLRRQQLQQQQMYSPEAIYNYKMMQKKNNHGSRQMNYSAPQKDYGLNGIAMERNGRLEFSAGARDQEMNQLAERLLLEGANTSMGYKGYFEQDSTSSEKRKKKGHSLKNVFKRKSNKSLEISSPELISFSNNSGNLETIPIKSKKQMKTISTPDLNALATSSSGLKNRSVQNLSSPYQSAASSSYSHHSMLNYFQPPAIQTDYGYESFESDEDMNTTITSPQAIDPRYSKMSQSGKCFLYI